MVTRPNEAPHEFNPWLRVVSLIEEAGHLLGLHEDMIQRIVAPELILEGRSAILIAHRLTTAQRADRIVVVDRGGIVETGTPAQLLATGGAYATMYAAWLASGGRDATREATP